MQPPYPERHEVLAEQRRIEKFVVDVPLERQSLPGYFGLGVHVGVGLHDRRMRQFP